MHTPELHQWRAWVICPKPALMEKLTALLQSCPGLRCSGSSEYPALGSVPTAIAKNGCNISFLDVGTDPDAALPLLTQIVLNGVIVVAVHSSTDPELILRCLRQGASEFFAEPLDPDELRAALQRLARKIEPPAESAVPGSIYSFVSGKGACGSTTIAANLALRLPQFGAKRVLLVDLDPINGKRGVHLEAEVAIQLCRRGY